MKYEVWSTCLTYEDTISLSYFTVLKFTISCYMLLYVHFEIHVHKKSISGQWMSSSDCRYEQSNRGAGRGRGVVGGIWHNRFLCSAVLDSSAPYYDIKFALNQGRSQDYLTQFWLNRLPNFILEESNFKFRYVRLWDLDIPRKKWLNCLQTVEILIRRLVSWVYTVCQLPFEGSPDYIRLIWSSELRSPIWSFDQNTVCYPKCSDRQARANSVDPDQTPQNAASDQGLHCLPLLQQC